MRQVSIDVISFYQLIRIKKMSKEVKIFIVVILGLLLFFIFAYVGAWMMAPGSYPRSEIYEFNVHEDSLIKIINTIKYEYPELNLPNTVILPDGRENNSDYWYHIYFYYKDKNKIIYTWTRPKTKNITKFAFVAINDGLKLGRWKNVNESFWWWENKPEKEEFERRILSKINNKIETKFN